MSNKDNDRNQNQSTLMDQEQALAIQEQAATNSATQALATYTPTINLPVLADQQTALEVISENLDGMGDFKFDKIDMPGSGGITFTVIDEEGVERPVQEIKGIVLDKFPFKRWYAKSFEDKDADDIGIPDCFSADNVHGSGFSVEGKVIIPAGQLCADCDRGQWGSDRKGGRGKDCADKIRFHILQEGNVFPVYIDTPPTSLANFKDYVKRLANKLLPFYGVVTVVGLERDKSGGGISYSKLTFKKAADLTGGERAAIKAYIAQLLPSMRSITRESIGEVAVGNVGAEMVEPGADVEGRGGAEIY